MNIFIRMGVDEVIVMARAEGVGCVGDLRQIVKKGETFGKLTYEDLINMGEGEHQYKHLDEFFARHDVVCHSQGEYVSFADPEIHTNTVEGFFSIFKRGMKGIYQHCKKQHLHRYLAEFDFRYNFRVKNGYDDTERAEILLKGVVGRRLTYQRASVQPQAEEVI